MNTGQLLVSRSGLGSATALQHFIAAMSLPVGETRFVSLATVAVSTPSVTAVSTIKRLVSPNRPFVPSESAEIGSNIFVKKTTDQFFTHSAIERHVVLSKAG